AVHRPRNGSVQGNAWRKNRHSTAPASLECAPTQAFRHGTREPHPPEAMKPKIERAEPRGQGYRDKQYKDVLRARQGRTPCRAKSDTPGPWARRPPEARAHAPRKRPLPTGIIRDLRNTAFSPPD